MEQTRQAAEGLALYVGMLVSFGAIALVFVSVGHYAGSYLVLILLSYVALTLLSTPSYIAIGKLLHKPVDPKAFLKRNLSVFLATVAFFFLLYLAAMMLLGVMIGQ